MVTLSWPWKRASYPYTLLYPEHSEETIADTLTLLEAKDFIRKMVDHHPETARHSLQVMELCVDIGYEIGLRDDDLTALGLVGLFHDTGKLSVPASILDKPGRLTPAEWLFMETHTLRGYETWKDVLKNPQYREIPLVCLRHHRFQLRPYPNGGEFDGLDSSLPLSLFAPFVAAADQLAAMTNRRAYKEPYPPVIAMNIIRGNYTGQPPFLDSIGQRYGCVA